VASVLDHDEGQTVAALTVVPVSADGTICVATFAPADVVVDVSGWFVVGAPIRPQVPARIVDTRATGQRLSPGGVLAVPAGDAGALAVTVTAVDPAAAGYLTLYPCGAAPPLASAVNFTTGAVANFALVGTGAGHAMCVASSAAADVVVDAAAAVPVGGGYQPVTPVRLVDTR
jgi:hypothetical protein